MKKTLQKKGFTLVEIMIVIAIIGLLASIAIPNLMRARMSANENKIKKDLRTFSTASEMFRAAQNPPVYAADVLTLGAAIPAYVEQTWNAGTRSGFNLVYAVNPSVSYSMLATPISNQTAINTFCVDQTGVIVMGAAGVNGTAAGCAGGAPIP